MRQGYGKGTCVVVRRDRFVMRKKDWSVVGELYKSGL